MMDAGHIIDSERYPITSLDGDARRILLDTCRRDLDPQAICTLPGFIQRDAIPTLVAEAEALASKCHRKDDLRTPYGWMCNEGFAPDHPRSKVFRNRSGVVLADQFPGDGPIETLYGWEPLTNFVRDVLGFESLYRTACPRLSLGIGVASVWRLARLAIPYQ